MPLLPYPTLPKVDAVPRSPGELVQARPADAENVPGQSSPWTASTRSRDGSSFLAWNRGQPKPSRKKVQENVSWDILGLKNFHQAMLHTGEGSQHGDAERSTSIVSLQHRVARSRLRQGLVWEIYSFGRSLCSRALVVGGCAALPGLFDCHQPCQISELALRTSLLLSLPRCQDQPAFCRGGGELHRTVKQTVSTYLSWLLLLPSLPNPEPRKEVKAASAECGRHRP